MPLGAATLAVVATTWLRYRDVGMAHALPFDLPGWWAAVLAGAGLTILIPSLRRRPADGRAALELLLPPAILALLWMVLPSDRWAPLHRLLVGLVGALVLLLLVAGRHRFGPLGWSRAGLGCGLRRLALPTLVPAGAALLAALAAGTPLRGERLLWSAAAYPLYALAQLTLFLSFTVPRLQALGASRTALLLVPAGLFGLVHWPNGPLVLLTAAAMLVWSTVFLRCANLLAPALSMGLLATVFTQLSPEDLTAHLRVGPGYVLREHMVEVYAWQEAKEAEWVGPGYFEAAGGTPEAWVRAVFTEILGRAPTTDEATRWTADLRRAWRRHIARDTFRSPEGRRKQPLPEAEIEVWVDRLASDAFRAEHGGTFCGWLDGLFREVLGRPLPPGECVDFGETPNVGRRKELLHALYHHPDFGRAGPGPAGALHRLGPLLPPHAYR
jgi:hypothetical protein